MPLATKATAAVGFLTRRSNLLTETRMTFRSVTIGIALSLAVATPDAAFAQASKTPPAPKPATQGTKPAPPGTKPAAGQRGRGTPQRGATGLSAAAKARLKRPAS